MTDQPWPPEGTRVRIVADGLWFGRIGVVIQNPKRGRGVELEDAAIFLWEIERHEIEVVDARPQGS